MKSEQEETSNHPTTHRMMKPPDTYDGSKPWSAYIDYFNRVAEVNGWKERDKVIWLLVSITGQAAGAISSVTDADKSSFDAVCHKLSTIYQPKARSNLYKAQFRNRSMNETEDFNNFANSLKMLCDQAHPDLDTDAKAELILEKFIEGVKPRELSFQIMSQNITNLEDAISCAIQQDTITKLRRQSESQTSAKQINSVGNPDTRQLVEALQIQVQALSSSQRRMEQKIELLGNSLQNLNDPQQSDQLNVMQSWQNGSPNRGFWRGRGNQWRGSRFQRGNRSTYAGLQCYRCHGYGHVARDCPDAMAEPTMNRGNGPRWFRPG